MVVIDFEVIVVVFFFFYVDGILNSRNCLRMVFFFCYICSCLMWKLIKYKLKVYG